MLDTTTGLMHTSFHLILMSFLQIKKHRFRDIHNLFKVTQKF